MPVERQFLSTSQFCELLGLDQGRFLGVENGLEGEGRKDWTKGVVIVMEREGETVAYSSEDGIQPPQSMTVDHDHKPVLYLPDGRALVRRAGFHGKETAMTQTSGTFPELAKTKKGGKKKR